MTKYGRIEVEEEIFRLGRDGCEIRPFKVSAGVECRSYSGPLQRVMVSFGAEESFDKAAQRIHEHYRIDLSDSAVRRVTLHHAEAINQQQQEERDSKLRNGPGAEVVIAEIDGSMVPIVSPDPGSSDRRKKKELKWEEMRLALAKEFGSVSPVYGVTMGSVEEAVEILADCVRRAGASLQTYLHCLGDGAKWIKQRIEKQFGNQASYLLDIYHVTEYLGAAAAVVAEGRVKEWVREKKEQLLENRAEEVIEELKVYEEGEEVAEEEAVVRACIRYMSNNRGCMDYKGAREAQLPIGSGEIEGGHRSVIQERLKVAGAWWLRENAQRMAALRVNRANGEWQSYWERVRQAAA